MIFLFAASLIWSFSFGLIKTNLAGINPYFIGMLRLGLSFLIFLPFLRISGKNIKEHFLLMITGAIQFGFMYIFYLLSYKYLPSYQVALFTLFTPLYVILIAGILEKKTEISTFLNIFMAISGSLIMVWKTLPQNILLKGFLLLQLANICFAAGQIFYRKINRNNQVSISSGFASLYLGAFFITIFFNLKNLSTPPQLSIKQLLTILYLGVLPSGIGFFLWNYGATKVSSSLLAIMNNMKIPLGILISLIIFKETASINKFLIGIPLVIFAFYNENKKRPEKVI